MVYPFLFDFNKENRMKKVAVVMGSDSDWPVVKAACQQLDAFGIPYEAHILSAHRSPAAAEIGRASCRERV